MAFKQLSTSATQTAVNAAATVAAGADLDQAVEIFEAIFGSAIEKLDAAVAADNALLAEEQAKDPAPAKASGGASTRGRKTGGRSNGKRSGGGSVTLSDARDMVLSKGAFEGVTLGALVEMSAEDAEADYGYGDGERSGLDYVTWLGSDDYSNDYVQRRARLILDDLGVAY